MLGKVARPQGSKYLEVVKLPTPAMKKALEKYHADMRKFGEDWFFRNKGSARYDLQISSS